MVDSTPREIVGPESFIQITCNLTTRVKPTSTLLQTLVSILQEHSPCKIYDHVYEILENEDSLPRFEGNLPDLLKPGKDIELPAIYLDAELFKDDTKITIVPDKVSILIQSGGNLPWELPREYIESINDLASALWLSLPVRWGCISVHQDNVYWGFLPENFVSFETNLPGSFEYFQDPGVLVENLYRIFVSPPLRRGYFARCHPLRCLFRNLREFEDGIKLSVKKLKTLKVDSELLLQLARRFEQESVDSGFYVPGTLEIKSYGNSLWVQGRKSSIFETMVQIGALYWFIFTHLTELPVALAFPFKDPRLGALSRYVEHCGEMISKQEKDILLTLEKKLSESIASLRFFDLKGRSMFRLHIDRNDDSLLFFIPRDGCVIGLGVYLKQSMPIPVEIFDLVELELLIIKRDTRPGNISQVPEEIASFSRLKYLQLDFFDEIPSCIKDFKDLHTLFIHLPYKTTKLPASLLKMPNLEIVRFLNFEQASGSPTVLAWAKEKMEAFEKLEREW